MRERTPFSVWKQAARIILFAGNVFFSPGCGTHQEVTPPPEHSLPNPYIEPTPVILFIDFEQIEARKHVEELRTILNTIMNEAVYKEEYEIIDTVSDRALFQFLAKHREKVYRGVRWDLTVAGMEVQIETTEETDGSLSKYTLFTSVSELNVPELQPIVEQVQATRWLTREKVKKVLTTLFKLPDTIAWKERHTPPGREQGGPASVEEVYGTSTVAGRRIEATMKQNGRIEVSVAEPFHTPFGKRKIAPKVVQ